MRGAAASDESARGNVNTILGATKAASDEALGKVDRRTTSATAAQDALLKRLLGGSTIAAAGDKSLQDTVNTLGTIGHNQAGDETDRLNKSGSLGLEADKTRTSQLTAMVNAGESADRIWQKGVELGLSAEQIMGVLTNMTDTQNLNHTTAAQDAANTVQGLFEKRKGDEFDRTFKVGSAQASRPRSCATTSTARSPPGDSRSSKVIRHSGCSCRARPRSRRSQQGRSSRWPAKSTTRRCSRRRQKQPPRGGSRT